MLEKPQPGKGVPPTQLATIILILVLIGVVIESADAYLSAQARASNEARWQAQIKINRLVAESIGLDPGQVKPSNAVHLPH